MKELIFNYLTKNYGIEGYYGVYYDKCYTITELNDKIYWLKYEAIIIFDVKDFIASYYVDLWLKKEIKRRRQIKQGFREISESYF